MTGDDRLGRFERSTFTHDGTTRDVFRQGTGPAVVVIAEMPGITPKVAEFARRVAAIGCTAVMPHLFGTPGKDPVAAGRLGGTAYMLSSLAPACVSREFTTWATNRTSPVNRGRWILEQLLCIVVPPPPPGVPQPVESNAPVREKLRLHREDPSCQGCHDLIDPAGLGMEEFDVIGARQTMDGGAPVDPTGAIPDGGTFVGAAQLATILQQDRRVPECITEKLMTYALGRGLEEGDDVFLSDIADQLPLEGDSVAKAIELIVLSPAFRMRGPKGAE